MPLFNGKRCTWDDCQGSEAGGHIIRQPLRDGLPRGRVDLGQRRGAGAALGRVGPHIRGVHLS